MKNKEEAQKALEIVRKLIGAAEIETVKFQEFDETAGNYHSEKSITDNTKLSFEMQSRDIEILLYFVREPKSLNPYGLNICIDGLLCYSEMFEDKDCEEAMGQIHEVMYRLSQKADAHGRKVLEEVISTI